MVTEQTPVEEVTPSRPEVHPPQTAPSKHVGAGALGVGVLCTLFTALYWNHFLSASAGGTFFFLGEQILKGRFPYRDFYLVVTPLHALKMSALIRLFGDQIIVARAESLVERILLGLAIYWVLARFCRSASAMLASFLTIVIAASDPADALMTYHMDSIFWAVAGTLCASEYLLRSSLRVRVWLAAASGITCALSLLTKQTVGLGITAAIAFLMAVILWRTGRLREALLFVVPFGAGWLAVVVVFIGWLGSVGALSAFLDTVFAADTSKGRPLAIIIRPFVQFWWLSIPLIVLTPLLGRFTVRRFGGSTKESASRIIVTTLAGAAVIGLALLSVATRIGWPGSDPYPPKIEGIDSVRFLAEMSMEILSWTGSAYVLIMIGWRVTRRALSTREQQILLTAGASFAVGYMLSLSWGAYSPMVVPGLGFVTALALDRFERHGAKAFVCMAALVLVLVYASASSKYVQPYAWMSWYEPPIVAATQASKLPKLAGLRLEASSLALTEDITQQIHAHTRPGNTLFVYPYFPLFYTLTDLNPPTKVFNPYLDVCPDKVCRETAEELLAHSPDAMIYMVEDEETLAKDEKVFRGGRKSASRDVVRAIEQLAPRYHKLLSAPVPGSSRVIEVYAKQ
jgi:hypothetical protein